MDGSIFMDKGHMPSEYDLQEALGEQYGLWMEIKGRVFEKYPEGREEWNFPGKKYGWSFRIKDKKRAILYLLPREHAFMVAFVFGGKAFNAIMESELSEALKEDLRSARVYAEGRGIRIQVRDRSDLKDIFLLLDFKLAF